MPKDVNLLEEYGSFASLERACRTFCEEVTTRVHRETRRTPLEMLAEERTRLHPLPKQPFTVAFGTTRRVSWDATISVEGVRYSVPHELIDTRVWARFHGDELIVTAVDAADGHALEVARHPRGTAGTPVLDTAHYPPRENKESDRTPKATNAAEAAFLMIGPGAATWLVEAATAGTRKVEAKMAEAVALSKLYAAAQVDRALGTAALTGRFAEKDLLSILDYQVGHEALEPTRASETHSPQPGTSAWSRFTAPTPTGEHEPDEHNNEEGTR